MGKKKKLRYEQPDTSSQRSTTGISVMSNTITVNDNDQVPYEELIKDYNSMRNGDCIAFATLDILKLPIMASELQITHPLGDAASERTKQAIDYLKYTFNNLRGGFNNFKAHLLTCLDFGHFMGEKVWLKGGDYRGKTTNLLTYVSPIQPMTVRKYLYDDLMHFSGIEQTRYGANNSQSTIELTLNDLLLVTHNGEFEDIRGRSVLRPGRQIWKEKFNVFMATSRGATRGAGIPHVKLNPAGHPNGEVLDTDMTKAITTAKDIGNSKQPCMVSVIGKSEIVLEELKNQTNNLPFLEYCDRQLFYNTLTEFMASGIGGSGSRAATSEHKMSYELKANAVIAEINAALAALSWEIIDNSFLGVLAEDEYPDVGLAYIGAKDVKGMMTMLQGLISANAITLTPEDEVYLRSVIGLPAIDIESLRNAKPPEPKALEKKKRSKIEAVTLSLPFDKQGRQYTPAESGIFEMASAMQVIGETETTAREELEKVYLDAVRETSQQLEIDPAKEPDVMFVGKLYEAMETRLKANYRQGYIDLQKEIGKGGVTLTKEPPETKTDKALMRKCITLMRVVRDKLFDRRQTLPERFIERKGGLTKYFEESFSREMVTLKNDIMSYVISGYTGGRGEAIQDSVEIIEELEYTNALENPQNVCEVCAPLGGLRMSIEEALDSGLRYNPGADGVGVEVNPECLGYKGGNKCRCQLIPTGIKQGAKEDENIVFAEGNDSNKAVKKVEEAGVIPELNLKEQAVIYDYSDWGYSKVNYNLNNNQVDAYTAAYSRLLNKALDKMPSYEGEVYRKATRFYERMGKDVGDTIKIDSFWSTSKDSSVYAVNDYNIIIKSKTGKDISKVSSKDNEKEVLFKTGTQFKFDSIEQYKGKWFIHLTEI